MLDDFDVFVLGKLLANKFLIILLLFYTAEGSACHVEVDGHLTPNVRDYLSIHEQVYDPHRTWMNITFDLGVMLVSALLFSPRSPHCDASTIFF